MFLRFLISSIHNNPWILSLMSDANNLLGNQKLVSLIVSLAAFMFGGVLKCMDLTSILHTIAISNDIKK